MKRARNSKTMWFALLLVILGALMDNLSYLQSIIDPQYYGVIMIAIGIVVAILRFISTEAIGKE